MLSFIKQYFDICYFIEDEILSILILASVITFKQLRIAVFKNFTNFKVLQFVFDEFVCLRHATYLKRDSSIGALL